jgi:hypothetical protein
VTVALLHPGLRLRIAETEVEKDFVDSALGKALREICGTDEPHGAMEPWIAEHLTAEQQAQLSASAVGPLIGDIEQAQVLIVDYVAAIERRKRQRELESLRRDVAEASTARDGEEEAWAKAQEVISLRRASETRR